MGFDRIHRDSRADHNALMALLCRQAAAAVARRISVTKDPAKRQALQLMMQEHEAQSEQHRRLAEELRIEEQRTGGAKRRGHLLKERNWRQIP